MNCYEFQDNISSYIEKKLTLSSVREFDRHLGTCASCRDAYEGVLSVLQSLRESKKVAVSDGFDARLRSRLKSSVARPAGWQSRYFQGARIFGFEPRYAVASVAALVLIVVLSMSLLPEKKGEPAGNPATFSTRGDVTSSPDQPELSPPAASVQNEFADDAKDDSTDAPRDAPASTRNFDAKIKLVKDQN